MAALGVAVARGDLMVDLQLRVQAEDFIQENVGCMGTPGFLPGTVLDRFSLTLLKPKVLLGTPDDKFVRNEAFAVPNFYVHNLDHVAVVEAVAPDVDHGIAGHPGAAAVGPPTVLATENADSPKGAGADGVVRMSLAILPALAMIVFSVLEHNSTNNTVKAIIARIASARNPALTYVSTNPDFIRVGTSTHTQLLFPFHQAFA